MYQAAYERAHDLMQTDTYRSACAKIRASSDPKWRLESLGAIPQRCLIWQSLQRDTGLTNEELVCVKIVQIIGIGCNCKYDVYPT
jgi:hypothetical protein